MVPGAKRARTVNHCINKSHLWQHFQVLHLTENMRVRASGDPVLEAFNQWTLSIGNCVTTNGSVLTLEDILTEITPNTLTEGWHEAESMKKFCQLVFPNLEENINIPG